MQDPPSGSSSAGKLGASSWLLGPRRSWCGAVAKSDCLLECSLATPSRAQEHGCYVSPATATGCAWTCTEGSLRTGAHGWRSSGQGCGGMLPSRVLTLLIRCHGSFGRPWAGDFEDNRCMPWKAKPLRFMRAILPTPTASRACACQCPACASMTLFRPLHPPLPPPSPHPLPLLQFSALLASRILLPKRT